jgi:hypothetical protein
MLPLLIAVLAAVLPPCAGFVLPVVPCARGSHSTGAQRSWQVAARHGACAGGILRAGPAAAAAPLQRSAAQSAGAPSLPVQDNGNNFIQCCRACSEWRVLDPHLGKLELDLAAGRVLPCDVAEALAAARERVLRPALHAAMELWVYSNRASPESHTNGARGESDLQACYEAATAMWSADGWEQALELMKIDDTSPSVDMVQAFRHAMRMVVGDIEDCFLETFRPAQEAAAGGAGAKYRTEAVTVDLSSPPPPTLPSDRTSGMRKRDVLLRMLTGKLSKREWLRGQVASLVVGMVSKPSPPPQLAVGMGAPSISRDEPAAPDSPEVQGSGGTDTQLLTQQWSEIPMPSRDELVQDDLPGLIITAKRDTLLSFDTRDPAQAAGAIAAIRRCEVPVVLKHVGQAQGWAAMKSWTLERLVAEFESSRSGTEPVAAGSGLKPLVNIRLAGNQNVLQCNRQHPFIQQGIFKAPSTTRQMRASEFVARIRTDRAARGFAPLVYGEDERLYLQSHATDGMLAECQVPREWGELGVEVSGCTNLWVSTAGLVSPLHYDATHSFLAQVRGRKRMVLWDASFLDSFYVYPPDHPLYRRSRVELQVPR